MLVVDDQDLIRVGLKGHILAVPNTKIVGEASNGEQAVELAATLNPDVIFMDLKMPGIGGAEASKRILNRQPGIKIIILTAIADDDYPRRMLRAGASAYMTKRESASAPEIVDALNTVAGGGIYISPELAQQMVVHESASDHPDSPFSLLSQREMEVAMMVASGHKAAEIAAIFNSSPKTINTHKYRVLEKLNVNNDVELALAAVKYKLIDPNQLITL